MRLVCTGAQPPLLQTTVARCTSAASACTAPTADAEAGIMASARSVRAKLEKTASAAKLTRILCIGLLLDLSDAERWIVGLKLCQQRSEKFRVAAPAPDRGVIDRAANLRGAGGTYRALGAVEVEATSVPGEARVIDDAPRHSLEIADQVLI